MISTKRRVFPDFDTCVDKNPDNFLGWTSPFLSMGYHGDDGRLFSPIDNPWHGRGALWNPKFGAGDVVGCGIVFDDQVGGVFFSLNGKLVSRNMEKHRDCKMSLSFAEDCQKPCKTLLGKEAKAVWSDITDHGFCSLLLESKLSLHPTIAFACMDIPSKDPFELDVNVRFFNFKYDITKELEKEGALYEGEEEEAED